ncbi:MAG: VWA domain-containing protein, partial [Planctomycetes bacterium]|nr:VWA domain-containing protein [Planctomycetota bacterium]
FYHHEVFRWKPAMVEAKGGARKQAVEFVEAMVADGNTNIYDALKLAFTYAGMGARDKHYDIGADTIFFLSDGQPNRGAVTATAAILAEVARWNELKRVKIHAVGVGKDHDAAFMRSLAESSGGTYVNR